MTEIIVANHDGIDPHTPLPSTRALESRAVVPEPERGWIGWSRPGPGHFRPPVDRMHRSA